MLYVQRQPHTGYIHKVSVWQIYLLTDVILKLSCSYNGYQEQVKYYRYEEIKKVKLH